MAFQSFVLVYVKNYFEFEIRNLCSPIPCNQLCQRSPIKLLIPRLLSYRYIVAFRESMHLKWNHSIFHFFFLTTSGFNTNLLEIKRVKTHDQYSKEDKWRRG